MTDHLPLLHKRHSVTNLVVHLIFTTKYRRKKMSEPVLADLRGILASLAESKGCFVLEINGEADHIHLLLQMPPQISVSNLVGFLKTNSSKIILERFPELRTFSNHGSFWSTSYFAASAGGVTIESLEKYVQDQGKTKRLSSPPFRTEVSRRMS